jgi:hypothetical protein
MEQVGRWYRVRRKVDGRTVTDSTYAGEGDALRRVMDLDATRRVLRRRLSDTPAPTLAQWAEEWLPAHTAGPVTLAKYECMLRVHILPRFGTIRLDAISRNDVKKFAVDLRGKVCAVSARTIVSVLGLVLREAIEEHYVYFDPTARLRLRDVPVVSRPIASPRQVWRSPTVCRTRSPARWWSPPPTPACGEENCWAWTAATFCWMKQPSSWIRCRAPCTRSVGSDGLVHRRHPPRCAGSRCRHS